MKTLFVCLVVAVLPLLLACSGDSSPTVPRDDDASGREPDPGSGDTGDPADDPVPGASLGASAGTVAGGVGTRCWGRLCIDYIGPITNDEPVELSRGERLELTFEAGPPSSVDLMWIPVDPNRRETTTAGLAWPGVIAPGGPSMRDAVAPADPGSYLLVAFARWAGRGDISYGFYIEVR